MRSRKKIKLIAKIYAANVIANAMSGGADSDLMSEEELGAMQDELQEIAIKLFGDLSFGELDRIIMHVDNLPKK